MMASDHVINYMPRCRCGRIVSMAKPFGWYKYGEHGSEEGWVCPRCLETWTPVDGRGRGPEDGFCGVVDMSPGEERGLPRESSGAFPSTNKDLTTPSPPENPA